MNSDKFKRQIESMWKYRDADEQKRLVKFTIAKTMRLTLEYPELAQEYFDSLCKVIPDNERITVSNYQHNLTSDAEGEKMLYVKRKWVQEMYKNNCDEIRRENISSSDKDCYEYANEVLKTLFGSKCLPDELTEDNFAKLHGDNLSPEPKPAPTFADAAPTFADDCKSRPNRTQSSYTQPVTNCHRSDRLHIAAMAMQALLSNADRMKMYEEVASDPLSDNLTRIVAHNALRYADALVAEAQKGGSHEKDNVQ